MSLSDCPDCYAEPGQLHNPGCDVEQCPRCGGQMISCACIYAVNGMDPDTLEVEYPDVFRDGPTMAMVGRWDAEWDAHRLPWTGEWPGDAECREFGWLTATGEPDLNRLAAEGVWDADAGRFRDPDQES